MEGFTRIQKKIFAVIKGKNRPLTIGEIATLLMESEIKVEGNVNLLVSEGWLIDIVNDLGTHKFFPAVFLDAPLPKSETEKKPLLSWSYETISFLTGKEQVQTTGIFETPFKKYFPPLWSQNGRGTCTGFSGAITMQSNYLGLHPEDAPTPEEVAQSAYNKLLNLGSCQMVYDTWFKTVFSAQWCYHIGRIEGKVTYPSGGITKYVMAAMVKYGGVPWDTCLTPKTPTCAPLTYPYSFEDTKARAADHKLKGYATLTTFDAIMNAIRDSPAHCVNMSTNLEMDYKTPSGGDVWKAHVGAEKAGSHALPWVDVDFDRRMIRCYNSWGDFPHTWIDEQFWRENCGPAFLPLDDEEAIIGKKIFVKTNLVSNYPAKFIIRDATGEILGEYSPSPQTVYLEVGKTYNITAVSLAPTETKEASIVKPVTVPDNLEWQETFSFTPAAITPPQPPKPVPGWVKRLRELLEKLFGGKK